MEKMRNRLIDVISELMIEQIFGKEFFDRTNKSEIECSHINGECDKIHERMMALESDEDELARLGILNHNGRICSILITQSEAETIMELMCYMKVCKS